MNQMHNLEKAADRKSVRKIFGLSYTPPNTSHVKNTEGPAHACKMQESGRLATLWSHSICPTHSVNISSSPGGGDTSQHQETASNKDTWLTLLPHLTPLTHKQYETIILGPSFGVDIFEERGNNVLKRELGYIIGAYLGYYLGECLKWMTCTFGKHCCTVNKMRWY